LSEFNGAPFVLLGQFKPLAQLLVKLDVVNLLQDIRVPRLVNFESFPAMRTDDVMHSKYPLP